VLLQVRQQSPAPSTNAPYIARTETYSLPLFTITRKETYSINTRQYRQGCSCRRGASLASSPMMMGAFAGSVWCVSWCVASWIH